MRLLRNLIFSLVALADRGAARHRGRAVPAARRLGGRAVAGDHRVADADPVERRRHDLADLRARGHRPVRRRADRLGPPLQRHAGADLGLVHDRRHRCLALDAAGHSAELCRACAPFPTPIIRRRASTRASRWAVFVNIELPKLQKVLVIAVLLRFMQTLHDLHRAVRRHRRRAGQRHDVPLHRPGQDRARAGRSRQAPRRCRWSTTSSRSRSAGSSSPIMTQTRSPRGTR